MFFRGFHDRPQNIDTGEGVRSNLLHMQSSVKEVPRWQSYDFPFFFVSRGAESVFWS